MAHQTPTKKVRTRFAPSPTGALHLGGLRTALINYLFAKQNNGDFILRIEDTDRSRNEEERIKEILDDLESLHLIPDESFCCPGEYGPYLQSQRGERYIHRITELLKQKKVYRCFCSQEELESEKKESYLYSGKCRNLDRETIKEKLNQKIPYCVRLKIDREKVYEWTDYVRGTMVVPASSLGDIVLMRSNGQPTYNFAATIDDYEMKITDVFRGEEHLSNTPYQIALYEAFGWEKEIPRFGHLSLILSEEGRKLSKRDPDSERYMVSYFLKKGYYPEALLNYLLILGWTEGEREFFTLKESIESFSTGKLSGSPSIFDFKKLDWMSQSYLNKLDIFQYLNFALPFLPNTYEEFQLNPKKRKDFAINFRSRVKYAAVLEEIASVFYSEGYLPSEGLEKLSSLEHSIPLFETALACFREKPLESWDEVEIRLSLKKLVFQSGLSNSLFYKGLRLALTGEEEGLPLHSVVFLLGVEKTIHRLERVIASITSLRSK